MTIKPVFDPIIHAPTRLQICAMLAAADDIDFAVLRADLAISDSVLSKHLRVLEEAGYLKLLKPVISGRVRTKTALTAAGREAYDAHIAELQRLVSGTALGRAR